MSKLLLLSVLLVSVHAQAQTQTGLSDVKSADCQVIQVTPQAVPAWSPLGTRPTVFVELTCRQPILFGSHEARVIAPVSSLRKLQAMKSSGGVYNVGFTSMGYGGTLAAIAGEELEPLQSGQRPDLQFNVVANTQDLASPLALLALNNDGCEGVRIECSSQFIAQDASQFSLSAIYSPAKSWAPRNPGGRPRSSPSYVRVFASGSNELRQQPGDDLVFSARDSRNLASFAGFANFPASLEIGAGRLSCETKSVCRFTR